MRKNENTMQKKNRRQEAQKVGGLREVCINFGEAIRDQAGRYHDVNILLSIIIKAVKQVIHVKSI